MDQQVSNFLNWPLGLNKFFNDTFDRKWHRIVKKTRKIVTRGD